jgi:hypothetical protein
LERRLGHELLDSGTLVVAARLDLQDHLPSLKVEVRA